MRKHLKHTGLCLSMMTLLIVLIPSGLAQDNLWDRAVSLQTQAENLIPGKLMMTMELKNRKKRVEMTQETYMAMVPDETGEITPKILKVLENGEDITEKTVKEVAEKKAEKEDDDGDENSMSLSIGAESSIFHPDNQEKITVERALRTETLNGIETVKYTFRRKVDDEFSEVGSAWLDPKTGMPLKLESSPDPLPDHVQEMITVTLYGTDVQGRLIMKRTEINGEGGFLFIKKYFSTTILYDEYFEHQKSETE